MEDEPIPGSRVRDALLVCGLLCMFGTGLPFWFPGLEAVQRVLGPPLTAVGLMQYGWELFAPHPASENLWLEVTLSNQAGDVATWKSPDWSTMAEWDRVTSERMFIFVRRLAGPGANEERRALIDYVARILPPPDGKPWDRGRVERHSWTIPRRSLRDAEPMPRPWPPPRNTFPDHQILLDVAL